MAKLRIGPRPSIPKILLLPWAENSCAVDCIIELGRHCEYLKIPEPKDCTPLQYAFAMTLRMFKEDMSDAELVVAKSPFLFSAREACGRSKDDPAFLPIGSLFEQTFLTDTNQDLQLTSVRDELCDACGATDSHRTPIRSIELYPSKQTATSVQRLIKSATEAQPHQLCATCQSNELTISHGFDVASTVVVDLAWTSCPTSSIKIDTAITTNDTSGGRRDFKLDAGVTYRDNHFKAFWRDRGGFTVYDGTHARDARATHVSLVPDRPMVLLYRCAEATADLASHRVVAPEALPVARIPVRPRDYPTTAPEPPTSTDRVPELITLVTITIDGTPLPGRPVIALCRTPETPLKDYLQRVRGHLPPLAGALAFARGAVVSDLLADEMRALFVDQAGWGAVMLAYPAAQTKLWINVEFVSTL